MNIMRFISFLGGLNVVPLGDSRSMHEKNQEKIILLLTISMVLLTISISYLEGDEKEFNLQIDICKHSPIICTIFPPFYEDFNRNDRNNNQHLHYVAHQLIALVWTWSPMLVDDCKNAPCLSFQNIDFFMNHYRTMWAQNGNKMYEPHVV